jgi:TrmH family RNA methyltransferase
MSLDNIYIIMVGVKHPGNIGSAARAMANMGISHLVLAEPKCAINEESHRLAKKGERVLDSAQVYDSLAEALQGIHFLAGTTGKSGGYRTATESPRAISPRILENAAQQKTGILFGPEDTGLVDEHLRLCQALIHIQTHVEASSINLAQAVMIVSYELYLASLNYNQVREIKLAPFEQTEAMYEQLEKALHDIDFLHSMNAKHMMMRLRKLFGRAGLQSSDVGILRGIARQIAWLAKTKQR